MEPLIQRCMAGLRTFFLSYRKLSLLPSLCFEDKKRCPSISNLSQNLMEYMQNSPSANRCLAGTVALFLPHPQAQIDEASSIHREMEFLTHTPHLHPGTPPSPPWCSQRPFLPGCNASSACFLINLLSPVLCSFNRARDPFSGGCHCSREHPSRSPVPACLN